MLFIICIIILASVRAKNFDSIDEDLSNEQLQKAEAQLKAHKVRCTRRFTPGACLEAVISVWTFDFQILNCTQRLGCTASHRTNRFLTYKTCMKRCRVMIDLYMQILAYDIRNGSLTQNEGLQARREGSDRFTSPSPAEEYVEYSGDEAMHAEFVYGEREVDYDDDL